MKRQPWMIYSSIVLGPGAAGSQMLFSTPRGSSVPSMGAIDSNIHKYNSEQLTNMNRAGQLDLAYTDHVEVKRISAYHDHLENNFEDLVHHEILRNTSLRLRMCSNTSTFDFSLPLGQAYDYRTLAGYEHDVYEDDVKSALVGYVFDDPYVLSHHADVECLVQLNRQLNLTRDVVLTVFLHGARISQ